MIKMHLTGFAKRYVAGDDGHIYSGDHTRPMVGWLDEHGYRQISLHVPGRRSAKRFAIHRLVCEAFHGPPPNGSAQVRHRDGVRANNKPSNLLWGSAAENTADRIALGNSYAGFANPNCKLTKERVLAIRALYAVGGVSQRLIAEACGIGQSHVSRIVARSVYSDVPDDDYELKFADDEPAQSVPF